VKKPTGLRLERWVNLGPGGATEGHYVYASLDEPFTIIPDPEPAYLDGVAYYERWLVGVWSPSPIFPDTGEVRSVEPRTAATLAIEQAGVIRFQAYTFRPYTGTPDTTLGDVLSDLQKWYPWGETEDTGLQHFGVNFKYNLLGPTAEAGDPCEIYTSQRATTVIAGTATHSTPGTPMEYRWVEGIAVLKDWAPVVDGAASLNLAAVEVPLPIGAHVLKLEVRDGTYTSSATTTLTISNTPPEAQPAPTSQVVEIGVDAILISGEVADFDGDALSYQWVKGGVVLYEDAITAPAGGAVVGIEDLVINAGDPRFPLGENEVQLVVSDGTNSAVTETVIVNVQDTTAPSLAPTSSLNMLWPANHELVPVTIWANGADNGGGNLFLTARVESSEPLDAAGDGSTEEDYVVTPPDNAAGTVLVQLRAERSGTGDGRVYTVTITATDTSGNSSEAKVNIRVPHDKRKK